MHPVPYLTQPVVCTKYLIANNRANCILHCILLIRKYIVNQKEREKEKENRKKYTHSTSFGIIMSLSEENAEIVLGWLSRFFVRVGHTFFTFLRPTITINKLLKEQ